MGNSISGKRDTMNNYKLTISYDGTRYHGWQSQKHTDGTIQQKLEDLLERFLGERVELHGSGRTDAGVHAVAQVANFKTKKELSIDELQQAFYDYLPQDIMVTEIVPVPERFHSRLSAKAKWYRYTIYNSPKLNVFERQYVWHLPEKLDIAAMEQAAEYLKGEHDFISFCSNKRMKKSSVRTVFAIRIVIEPVLDGNRIHIDYYGDGFLYNMVRILTGTLIEVGQHKKKPIDMQDIFAARNRQFAGITAPPMGLKLMEVYY